ncbi:MAG TPA: DUF1295 domain-containing protein [Candidatus Methylomirabilis sp.]|nr:DUF1295 domain-containing protein [Candidatus Methylomirabilis sp.]
MIRASTAEEAASSPPVTYATAGKRGFKRVYGLLLFTLPPLVYYLWICARYHGGALVVPSSREEITRFLGHVPLPTAASVAFCAGWFGLQILLQMFAPGRITEGVPLADGTRLTYRMNGWFSWWFTLALVAALVGLQVIPSTFLYDQFGPLLTTFNLVAFAFSVYLHWHGRHREKDESTGRPLYDFFMGTSLNPRIRGFDLKLFCEARPGLILWILINASIAAKQRELHGSLSTAMILVNAFHFLYIVDYFFNEEAVLTTMDIRHEKFGWMLCWGDLVWVPFTYTLQAQYLAHHPHSLPVWAVVAITLLNLAGYAVFRRSNLQKHRFRAHPEASIWGRPPESIRTRSGALLLASGWWGIARHPNYLGDLMMALAWCLPCLFRHVLPYFYVIYFTMLLIDRERRDNEMCHAKYGADWETYQQKVRWRILPGVY